MLAVSNTAFEDTGVDIMLESGGAPEERFSCGCP